MSRIKLSEFRAKQLVYSAFDMDYRGIYVDLSALPGDIISQLPEPYAVKVDQAVKKRNTLGLVRLKRTEKEVMADLRDFAAQGYKHALIEPYHEHERADEHFVAIQLVAEGIEVHYSPKGGVDVERHRDAIQSQLFNTSDVKTNNLELDTTILRTLVDCFEANHMTYLEINPLVLSDRTILPLDTAVEVDSAAEFFVDGAWSPRVDGRSAKKTTHPHEAAVDMLASRSPASLNLKVLNPDGSLFLLLSGGGASVVIADEVANLGYRDSIANYGEYSGNPSEEETYLYTKELLGLLLASRAPKKVLLIAGGVANFTDVAQTFKGIIRAIKDEAPALKEQAVAVFVRRGGPNQEKGLALMEAFLSSLPLKHEVHGPEVSLGAIVRQAVGAVQND